MQEIKIVPKVWGEERWIVNRGYCGKLLVLKKAFRCSIHYHKDKDETFYVNKGKVLLELDGNKIIMGPGQAQLVKPNQKHRFTGLEDSEIIEFSSHHEDSDSYRDEPSGPIDLSTIELPEEKE
jgi:quercetin dioxygenase-like cupin family protein